MSIVQTGISALTRLLIVAGLGVFFLIGMASVVYMSLQGREVTVPDLVGKNYAQTERELSALGLKVHKRASRPSPDSPDTVLEQIPKPGETVKTGQRIMVVTSTPGPAGEEVPSTLKKTDDDAEKIEEMISEKPKKAKANTNTKKKAETTRDVSANSSNTNSNSNTAAGTDGDDKTNKNSTSPAAKPSPAAANRPVVARPSSGDTRPRSTPKP